MPAKCAATVVSMNCRRYSTKIATLGLSELHGYWLADDACLGGDDGGMGAAARLQLVDDIPDVFFSGVQGNARVAAIILFESPFPISLSTSTSLSVR